MDAYSAFKPLRNKLKRFTTESLIELCAVKLHELKAFPTEKVRMYPPWFVLALLKWAILYSDPVHPKSRNATIGDFIQLVQMVHQVFDAAPVPRGAGALLVFLKNMAFQQLWLQDHLAASDFGRQIVLFEQLPRTDAIKDLFASVTGLDMSAFMELTSVLACRFLTDNSIYVGTPYFQPLGYPHETTKRFLSMFSLDRKGLRPFLEVEENRIRAFENRLYEQTPLKRRPLLMLDDGTRYLCYSPNLLFFALSTFVYDKLKEHSPEAFSHEFGKVFENYIGKGLKYAGVDFIDETALKQQYPNSLVVDFKVTCEDAIVLIESKAIELSPHARVAVDPTILSNNLRDSVTKAIKQGFVIATQLLNAPRSAEGLTRQKIFLLIVTYKDLFIGNGNDFLLSTSAKEEIDRFIIERNLNSQALDFNHIFFLSAHEFERLMYVVQHDQTKISAILTRVAEANSAEKKLQFGQHLRHLYKTTAPDFEMGNGSGLYFCYFPSVLIFLEHYPRPLANPRIKRLAFHQCFNAG